MENGVFVQLREPNLVHAVRIKHGSKFEIDKMYFFNEFIIDHKNVEKALKLFDLVIEEVTVSGVIIRFDEKQGGN
ncbi:hypothetical protein ACW5UC_24945 [Priestia aryabhattai]|uniref:hypothetical protein n=1 Tax=Priestia megaterium TaxID=1404 RepID=UPI003F9DC6F2